VSAIDRSILDEMAEIMGEEFPDLVRTYLDSAPDLIQQLQSAVQQDGIDALIGPAHSLKASSNDLGATQLAEVAEAIENAARTGDISARDHVPKLQSRFDAAQTELQKVIDA